MKTRIIKRTGVAGGVRYVIQQKHFIFRWWWVDASVNSLDYVNTRDYFDTLDDAKKHLCYFDGTKIKEEVL